MMVFATDAVNPTRRAKRREEPLGKRVRITMLRFALPVLAATIAWAEKDPEQRQWLWADAGFISQNIYLFCASEGLATGVRALVDRPALAKALGLKENQLVLLAQCVGRPAPPPGSRKHGSAPPSLQNTRDEGACNGVRLQIYRGNHTAGARPRWDLHGLPPCAPVTSVRSRKIYFPSVIISGSSLSYTRNKQCPRGNGSDLDSPERQEAT